jgi:hypothetical protein
LLSEVMVMKACLLLLAAVAVTLGCSHESTSVSGDDQILMPPAGIIMVGGAADIPPSKLALDILEVHLLGDLLFTDVRFSGCTPDREFALYGSKGFMESLPVQAGIFLWYDGPDEACSVYFTRTLVFDLSPLKEEYLKGYEEGPIRLRIVEPGSTAPYEPLPLYTWHSF